MATRPLPALLLLLPASAASARPPRVPLPVLRYSQLDSLIADGSPKAFFFWGTWCAPCYPDVDSIIRLFNARPGLALYLVNDPESRDLQATRLMQLAGANIHFYRMEPVDPRSLSVRRLIRVNDFQQVRYFNAWMMRGHRRRMELMRCPVYYSFGPGGKPGSSFTKAPGWMQAIGASLDSGTP